MSNNLPLKVIQVMVLGGIVAAFLMPVLFPGSEPEEIREPSSQSVMSVAIASVFLADD